MTVTLPVGMRPVVTVVVALGRPDEPWQGALEIHPDGTVVKREHGTRPHLEPAGVCSAHGNYTGTTCPTCYADRVRF